MKQSDKIDLYSHNRTWKTLPDMREGRCNFNPCLFNGYVYLCGQYSQQVEAFSPQTELFLRLQVEVPESTSCCLYVHNSLLVVHSKKCISKFTVGQSCRLSLQSQVRSQAFASERFNSQPVVDSSCGLCFIICAGKVFTINLESGAQARLI